MMEQLGNRMSLALTKEYSFICLPYKYLVWDGETILEMVVEFERTIVTGSAVLAKEANGLTYKFV